MPRPLSPRQTTWTLAAGVMVLGLGLGACTPAGSGAGASTPPSPGGPSSPAASAPASPSPESGTPSASATPDGPAQGTVHTVAVVIAGGKVTPIAQEVEARVGDSLTITATSDAEDELHLHGVDQSLPVTPGQEASMTVPLEQAGQFELETHGSHKVVALVNVR